MKKTLKGVLLFATTSALLVFIFGRLGYYHWIPDLLSHFRVLHVLGVVILLLTSFIIRHKWSLYINLGLLIILIIPLLKFYVPVHSSKDMIKEPVYNIVSINVLSLNRNSTKVLQYIQQTDFDLILFTEVNGFWANKLSSLHLEYPYRKQVVREGNFGMAIFSKYPLNKTQVLKLCRTGIPTFKTEVNFSKNTSITIFGLHPEPPDDQDGFDNRNELFMKVNDLIKEEKKEVILLGDLNCTAFSCNMNRLLKNTELKDSRIGFGLLPSWNQEWPGLISIPLDHLFVSKGLLVCNRSTGPNIGSDHLPAEMRFFLKNK